MSCYMPLSSELLLANNNNEQGITYLIYVLYLLYMLLVRWG